MMDTKTGLKIAYRRKMPETLRTLSFAKEKHAGQYRKGDGSVPYIVQPLNSIWPVMLWKWVYMTTLSLWLRCFTTSAKIVI